MDGKIRQTFPKNERLCRKRLIDLLFSEGLSFVAFPLRVIYLPIDEKEMETAGLSAFVSVPKKKIKHAVDRNLLRRRIRESLRLRKGSLIRSLNEKEGSLLLAFIYLDRTITTYSVIDGGMEKLLRFIEEKVA
ncbi:MAG: ribonuclease P protein component [Tannerella sp.]|jgi:ribonuclease P protein component|nr:ribonuclease P protein component [Tannerella sp.]